MRQKKQTSLEHPCERKEKRSKFKFTSSSLMLLEHSQDNRGYAVVH
ncbi:unnamed protein product [Callosobruchus maculatus]|uniref:Uncharacterized protein n=1 Tax=Callosobruchus maculatus TaxID=64391 RepID=A0A653CM22_CALMS|nr:unnamed protein product [Callosobruchus maculatus]